MSGVHRTAPGRLVRALGAAALAVTILAAFPSPAGAQDDGLRFEASIDGRPLDEIDGNDPLPLASGEVEIVVAVDNTGDEPASVRYVSFVGRALSIEFFSYVTRVDMVLAPGEREERAILLDIGDLDEQATGLMPARFSLLDDDRDELTSQDLAVEIDGSMGSVYGVFGLAVLGITGLLLAFALLRLFTNRLPVNRWRRATYFAVPGIGIGLSATFGCSVLEILTPSATAGLTFALVCGAIGFVLGYLTPNPYDETIDLDELDEVERMQRREAIAASVLAEQRR